jgi:putative transposase
VASIPPCGRRLNRLREDWLRSPPTLHEWVKRTKSIAACVMVSPRRARTHQGPGARGQGTAPGQRDPEAGERVFRPGGARPPHQVLRAFVDQFRDLRGRADLQGLADRPVRLSAPCRPAKHPELRCARAQRDDALMPDIQRVWQANLQVYGADKVWRQLNREGIEGGPLHGGTADEAHGPGGRAAWQEGAHHDSRPRRLVPWIGSTGSSRRIARISCGYRTSPMSPPGKAGCTWPLSSTCSRGASWAGGSAVPCDTDFVLDALEQALYDRQPEREELIHHSDRGSQYVSIRYTERLAEAGIEPSVGSRGTATTTPWPRPSTACTRPS